MATGKFKKKDQGAANLSARGAVHNVVVSMPNDPNKNESDVPISFLVSLVVMCIVLIIALPVMGMMYVDMNNATVAAMEEVRKMRELRAKILMGVQE